MSLEKWRVLVGHIAAPNKWNKEEWISGGIQQSLPQKEPRKTKKKIKGENNKKE